MNEIIEQFKNLKNEIIEILNRVEEVMRGKFCNDPSRTCMTCEYNIPCLTIYNFLKNISDITRACLSFLDDVIEGSIEIEKEEEEEGDE